ncbi:transposase [Streptomyces decoyicus]|uniref:transposase n=1 Tax=Streptomyces decoyicus TaxID=249567 RepID=UPI0033A6ED53
MTWRDNWYADHSSPRTRPARALTDRAYSSREIREFLRRRQIPHTIPEKRDQAGHRLRRARRAATQFRLRNVQRRHKAECRIGLLKQARSVAGPLFCEDGRIWPRGGRRMLVSSVAPP